MRKIIYIGPRYHTNLVGSVDTLRASGFEVTVLATLKGRIENYKDSQPVILREALVSKLFRGVFGDGGVNRKRAFPSIYTIIKLMLTVQPDVAIIRIHGLMNTYLFAIFLKLFGCRIIFYQQVAIKELSNHFEQGIRGRIRKLKFISRLKVFKAKWYTPLGTPNDIKLLPRNAYFVPFCLTKVPKCKNKKVATKKSRIKILSIGKYQERKQHNLLVNAVELLSHKYEIDVTIIGECSTPAHRKVFNSLTSQISDKKLTESIRLMKNIPHEKIGKFYQQADLFVLPADKEPASISVLEALNYGLPTICSSRNGTKSYVCDGVNGFVFESCSLDSLVETLERALNRNTHANMQQNLTTLEDHYFSPDNFFKLL